MTASAGELWPWAVDIYARPGVADACVELQDAHGQNVPLLLWALWSAGSGRSPDLDAGVRLARAWETEVVAPLRRLRRALKTPSGDMAEDARETVRAQVKAVELEAERHLLAGLARAPADPEAPPPPPELLSRTAAAWGAPLPPSAFGALLRALNPGAV